MNKQALLSLLDLPGVPRLLKPLRRGVAVIFMLHRFDDPERGVVGQDPVRLGEALAELRRLGFTFVGLRELATRLRSGDPPLRGEVAFTIDDGYYDHARIAAPVFREHDCPVTTFVTTGFLDGELWFWWDKVSFILAETAKNRISVPSERGDITLSWDSPAEREGCRARFVETCKTVANDEMHALVGRLADAAEVALPSSPPEKFAPMTWEELRGAEEGGMTFGPHTVSHPILSKIDDQQSEAELRGSWERLREKAKDPVAVFCYPNGQPTDFGDREIGHLRALGFQGAVVGGPGYAVPLVGPDADRDAFSVERVAFDADRHANLQVALGVERLKSWFRR